MKPRHKRILGIGLFLAGLAIAVTLALMAFEKNLLFFFTPGQVMAGEAPVDHPFRVGGMAVGGSVQRIGNSLTVNFELTDYEHTVTVSYTGILPALFREGQGIIARGKLDSSGTFIADEVLSKHDENYMPPEVADMLVSRQTD